MGDVWLYLRLSFALAVVLAPGFVVARALGLRGISASLAWALGIVFAGLAITFLLSASLVITLVIIIGLGLAAVPYAVAARPEAPPFRTGRVALLAGVLLGIALWWIAGEIGGDGLFHLARARKLVEFGDLSLHSLDEFPDGDLHPGYAFPLWHGVLALVAKVAGTDPANVVLHGPSVLAPLALVAWAEAGYAVFRRRRQALAVALVAVLFVGFAPGHGGAYTALALPATASRQLLVPVLLTTAFAAWQAPRAAVLATAGVASLAIAVVHPTYLIFVWLVLAGAVACRFAWTRAEALRGVLMLGALIAPAGVFFLWLRPHIAATVSVSPDRDECLRGFAQYAGQLRVSSCDSFSVVPELFGRSGSLAIGALVLAPLAVLAARRRWAALVVGGGLAVLLLTLVPFLYTPLSDAVSISQSRRLVGFFPFAFALVGGFGLLVGRFRRTAPLVALAAGVGLQLLTPGDFAGPITDGGPGWLTWASFAGLAAAALAGLVLARGEAPERSGVLCVVLFAFPVLVHGAASWSPSEGRPPSFLTPGLVAEVEARLPAGGIVYADLETGYRLAAFTPVKICVAPPAHVADTVDNRPRARVRDFLRFVRTGDLSIPRGCGAQWIVVDERRFKIDPGIERMYRDGRFALYRISD